MRVPSITDIVREYIEKSIYTGKFKPGSKVTEAEVAAELKISRPPIREAFKLLEAEGLILRIPETWSFRSRNRRAGCIGNLYAKSRAVCILHNSFI